MSETPEIQPPSQPSALDTRAEVKPTPAKSRSWSWGCLGMVGCLLAVVVIVSLPIILGFTTVNGLLTVVQSSVQNILNPPSVAIVDPSQTIVQSVMPLGQLVSVSIQLAKADIQVSVHE